MSLNKVGVGAAVVAAAAAIVVGGSALANAAGSSLANGSAGYGASGYGAPGAEGGQGGPGGHGGRGPGGQGGSADTPVTGDELAKVTAAVKAKDASITVTSVQKDPDGSYDVYGTKAGAQVAYDVSADLKTFTARTGGRGGPGGHGGGPADTPVTGDELAKVTAAVKAKDSAVTVARVQKDPDGSYDVFGTKAGAPVMFEVSTDLRTITQNTFQGRQGGGAPPAGAPSANT